MTYRNRLANHKLERLSYCPKYDAAILLPFVETEQGTSLLFEVRNQSIMQGGEICFPGGRIEPGETAEETAIRETAEELRIDGSRITVEAPLFSIPGPGGAFVTSFAGSLTDYRGTWNPAEVERTFTIPLSWFLAHEPELAEAEMETVCPEDFPFEMLPGGKEYPWRKVRKTIRFYKTDEAVIWGITADHLYRLIRLIKEES